MIGKSGRPEGDGVIWKREVTHSDEDMPNSERDPRSATAGNHAALIGVSARGGFPLAETAPVSRKK